MSRGPNWTPGTLTAACLSLLAGCAGTAGFEGPDPLTGGPPIQRRTSPAPTLAAGLAPNAYATPNGGGAAGAVPPVSAPNTATSQAALAAGVLQPLDTSRDLRIGPPPPPPAALANEQPLWRGSETSAPTAHLNDPQTPADARSTPFATAGTAVSAPGFTLTGGGTTRVDSFERAEEQLLRRRVTWQKLESVGESGEWRFRCSVPNPDNANTERYYDARARSPLAAVQAVLDQMALEQR